MTTVLEGTPNLVTFLQIGHNVSLQCALILDQRLCINSTINDGWVAA